MQYFAIIAAGLAAQALAQQSTCDGKAAAIPQCAQACIKKADAAVGCDEKNYKCGCDKQSEIQTQAAPCIIAACPASEIAAVQAAAADLCKCAEAAGTGSGSQGGSTPTPGGQGGASHPNGGHHHSKTGYPTKSQPTIAPYPTATGTGSYPAGNGSSPYPTIATGMGNAVQPMMAWTGAALAAVAAVAML